MYQPKVAPIAALALTLIAAVAPTAHAQSRSQGDRVAQLFIRFDTNRDGKLVADEVPAPVWTRLSAADLDADGAVTMAEVHAYRSGR